MLSEKYKREALRKLKSLTAEEVVEMLEAIGSTRKSTSSDDS